MRGWLQSYIAEVKLCDKRMEQWKAIAFTKVASPKDFEAAATLAAHRMACV